MSLNVERPAKEHAIGLLVRGARSVYELLSNRRKYERIPCSGNVFLVYKGPAVETTYACLCVDVSPRGIAVDCPERMDRGTVVQLFSAESGPHRHARVRYCVPRDGRHRIGLEFIEEHGRNGAEGASTAH